MPTDYRAVFAGKTKDGARIVLYRDAQQRFHIKVDAEPLLALSPNTAWETTVDRASETVRLRIKSPEWTGEAVCDRYDMIAGDYFSI